MVKTQEICKSLYLTRPIVVKIISRLKSCGFIVTKTGKDGGLTVSEKVKDASLYDILCCMGFSSRMNQCLTKNQNCQLFPICKVNRLFSDIQQNIEEKLRNAKVSDFLFNNNKSQLVEGLTK